MIEKQAARRLEYHDRFALQQADQAIRKDVVRALVELITNSNDSYFRMETNGNSNQRGENHGEIIVEIRRKMKNAVIRVRDYAEVRGDGRLTPTVVDAALEILQIDALGLDSLDRDYLNALIKHYDGGPAGIEAIAASMGHERDTLEDVVEPYLLQIGFVIRTPRGRVVRPAAYAHLGLEAPTRGADEPSLFE